MKISGFILQKSFEKDYARSNLEVKNKFRERRNLLLIDSAHPILNNHPLQGKLKDYWSINITGDFRALYKVEGNIAVFIALDTHSNLYK